MRITRQNTEQPEIDDYNDDPIEELSELLGVPYSEVERIYNLFDEEAYSFTIETFERIWERNLEYMNYGGI